MTRPMQEKIREATRLTGTGRLMEATAAIQRMLGGNAPIGGAGAFKAEPPTIDGVAERVSDPRRAMLPGGFKVPGAAIKAPGVPHAENGRFIEATFSNAAGSRPYKLYVPQDYSADRPLPLVVMLHGCTQSPDDFAAGTGMNDLADSRSFLVAYPGQTKAANMQKCWNWFSEDDQHRDAGEPSLIAGITRKIMADYAVDPNRVYVAGLSAGGAAAAIMGASYPDLYAAIGVHSGLACGAARDMPSAFGAMRQGAVGNAPSASRTVPAIVFHGDSDATVNVRNGDAVSAQSAGPGRLDDRIEKGQVPGGGRAWTKTTRVDADGRAMVEQWVIHGAGHAWSGGRRAGSYTDPEGPNASAEMVRFFLEHPRRTS
jgi:poly(hydroxyalkanoate) depolymerase family esterase